MNVSPIAQRRIALARLEKQRRQRNGTIDDGAVGLASAGRSAQSEQKPVDGLNPNGTIDHSAPHARNGRALKIDGIYGPKTRQAVLDIQKRHPNLVQDGEVGWRTFVELLREVENLRAAQAVQGNATLVLADAANDAAPVDRAVQLARDYGTRLGLAATQGGQTPSLNYAFKPSPETGRFDADALEVATLLNIPHRTDMPMTNAILDRDGDILYAAIGAQAKVLNDEEQRRKQGLRPHD